jgi:MgtE intracellular N domain
VYHCQWAIDEVHVVVAGQLSREAHNAPLHLFSAKPELVGFGQTAYQRRSKDTSLVLGQLFDRLRGEGFTMSFTMEDFKRELTKEYFKLLSPQEQREALRSLPPAKRRELLESWPPEELQQYLDQLSAGRPAASRKPRRKK